jgi:uncharacterized membrane protein
MLSHIPVAKTLLFLLAMAAWTIGAHVVFANGEPSRLATFYAGAPIAVTAAWLLRHARWRAAWFVLITALLLAVVMIVPVDRTDASLVYQLQYLAMQGALAVLFGRTLLAGREPLVTRFARIVRGELQPAIERYTRSVTLAWTLFFVAMGLIAVVLYAAAPREAWSAFVNLFTIPCVLGMFIAEYAVRRIRFPALKHSSILAGARAFQRAFTSREPPP